MRARTSDRRDFLRSTTIASAGLALSPLILRGEDKTGAKDVVIGTGEHTYRCIHHWGRESLPAGHSYGNASHGVAVDSQGLIYITHTGHPDSIFVFDEEARFVRSMAPMHAASPGRGAQAKKRPSVASGHGIDIRKENNEEFIYLAPTNPDMGFTKLSLAGEVVWSKDQTRVFEDADLAGNPEIKMRPTNSSFRPDGGYYLGDGYGSGYLFEYGADDRFIRKIGGPGTDNGQFRTPHGHWLDDRDGTPKLVVADRANERLQWFDMDGKHLQTLGGFLFPADIDQQGELLLVPDLHARITILGKDNQVLVHLGDDATWREQVLADKFAMRRTPEKCPPGRFVHPHDACFDAQGNIFVTEWVVGGRVTKLERVS
ncbi:MAG: peptidase [Planctomycetaceae bacterium]